MAILVDDARWPWQGTTWCHLVTDSHLDELHEFARILGCRRVGFQGDHYDIDIDTRTFALTMGAQACSSRDLVRRLRAAGLRLRPSQFEKWELVERWDGPMAPADAEAVLESLPSNGNSYDAQAAAVRVAGGVGHGGFRIRRDRLEALVVHGDDRAPVIVERGDLGIYCRVDQRGRWGVELTSAPLESAQ